MANFIVYDLAFLVLFTLFIIFFLYKRRHNLERQGILYLYKTKLGIKLMDWTVAKFRRILRPLEYVVIASGYILMISVLWMIIKSAWTYLTSPFLAELLSAPPIAPLIPYFPRLFNLDAFFPPLYFTFFIIALIIVAVSHEFSHGIFARLNKIKVKTTGFAFLGPILGAFVEPDEKQMEKAPKKTQLSILAAGTFANVIMTIIFGLIIWIYFSASFMAAGINFNSYPQTALPLNTIDSLEGVPITDLSEIPNILDTEKNLHKITANGNSYLVPSNTLKISIEQKLKDILVFDDAPAINAELDGPILAIDGKKITSFESLSSEIKKRSPGDTITITTVDDSENPIDKEITLIEKDGEAYLGIAVNPIPTGGIRGALTSLVAKVKDPFVYYQPKWNGDFAWFIYQLLWWIVVINILVALFNMLPLGILDGGRFFFLTIWGLTGSESFGKRMFSFITWFILILLLLMMIRWALRFF